jgi:uncharacterized protein (TIGR03663 family)
MKKKTFTYLFFFILAIGLLVRSYELNLRPMHHDEANQAAKFGLLLEKGEYRYDPADHHGPTLYYLSLPFAWLSGQKTYAQLTESTLRGVTVFFGVGILLLLLLAGKYLNVSEKLCSALLLAISPPLVYFSRFYIQETLFVFFALGFIIFLWRFYLQLDFKQAVWLGIFAGLLFSTKETSIIVFAASILALVAVWFVTIIKNRKARTKVQRVMAASRHERLKKVILLLILAMLIFISVSFIFYSSFLQKPEAFLDSFKAFFGYSQRAVEAGWHHHGFWYYFELLFFQKAGPRSPVFSEVICLILAVVGMVIAFARASKKTSENFKVFVAIFALVTALIYSAIPYKTPWNLLLFYASFLILAGVGMAHILAIIRWSKLQILLLTTIIIWTGWQLYLVNYYFHSYPDNPYVYAQTSPDFLRLIDRIDELSQVADEGKEIFIGVIASPYETWPLPWYLRKYGQVGYWTQSEQVETLATARIVVITGKEILKRSEKELEPYVSQYYSLRSDVLMVLLIHEELWEKYREKKVIPRKSS